MLISENKLITIFPRSNNPYGIFLRLTCCYAHAGLTVLGLGFLGKLFKFSKVYCFNSYFSGKSCKKWCLLVFILVLYLPNLDDYVCISSSVMLGLLKVKF